MIIYPIFICSQVTCIHMYTATFILHMLISHRSVQKSYITYQLNVSYPSHISHRQLKSSTFSTNPFQSHLSGPRNHLIDPHSLPRPLYPCPIPFALTSASEGPNLINLDLADHYRRHHPTPIRPSPYIIPSASHSQHSFPSP